MRDEPKIGDRWSIIAYGSNRYEFVIVGFTTEPGGYRYAVAKSPATGKIIQPVAAKTLRRGLRGARLVSRADGTAGEHRRIRPPRVEVAGENRDASDIVKVARPRGVVDRDITFFETRCAQLRAQGLSQRAIAKETRKTQNQVFHALQNVDDIRSLRALRQAG